MAKLAITTRENAFRNQRCVALVELELPIGWHSLPRVEQERALRESGSRAVDDLVAAWDIAAGLESSRRSA